MLIQFFLAILENLIVAFFISKLSSIEKKGEFILCCSIITSLLTTFFNFYVETYSYLLSFITVFVFIFGVYIFKKNVSFNEIIYCVLALVFILLTDLIALILTSVLCKMDVAIIFENKITITIASLLAKFLLFPLCASIIFWRNDNEIKLNYKKWWMLFPVWFMLFLTLYFLSEAIVYNSVNLQTIYITMTNLIILSFLILILFLTIHKENRLITDDKLAIQRENYIRKNKNMISKLHNEVSDIEHRSMYQLLLFKTLIENNKSNEILKIIDKQIHEFKKHKNLIDSGNPYFDHLINKEINNILMKHNNVKTRILKKYPF